MEQLCCQSKEIGLGSGQGKTRLLKMPIHQLCQDQISTICLFHYKKKERGNLPKLLNMFLCFKNPEIKLNDRKTY